MDEFRVNILNQRGLAATYMLEGLFEKFASELYEILGQGKTREQALITTKLQEAYLFAQLAIGLLNENRCVHHASKVDAGRDAYELVHTECVACRTLDLREAERKALEVSAYGDVAAVQRGYLETLAAMAVSKTDEVQEP